MRATLVAAAQEVIRRDGVRALTMRAVAQQAGCALGLPYKFFANREDLVLDVVASELRALTAALEKWVARSAGTRTVASNLDRYATILLDADSPALLQANDVDDQVLAERARRLTAESGLVRSFDEAIAEYLRAEQRLGRVRTDVDVDAFGFLITGAIHNLVTAGDLYPRPSRRALRRHIAACADVLAPS